MFDKVNYIEIDEKACGQRIDNFLITKLKKVPKSHIYKIIRCGEIRVNKKRIKATYKLNVQDQVRIPPVKLTTRPKIENQGNPGINLDDLILFEDNNYLVVNKPSGMAVHGGSGISWGLIELFRQHYKENRYLELAHRLDKETSGILIFAKKRRALCDLHDLLKLKKAEKKYIALLSGKWTSHKRERLVDMPLKKNVLQNGERMVLCHPEGKSSQTHFKLLKNFPNCCLVEVSPYTGRTHQIRVHAKHLGMPIIGDNKYGDKRVNLSMREKGCQRLFLHAASMSFFSELTTKKYSFTAPLDDILNNFLSLIESNTL